MGFGLVSKRSTEYSYMIDVGNGYKPAKGAYIAQNPSIIKGYIATQKKVNLLINGLLANDAFNITSKPNKVEFEYKGDASLFKKPVLLTMEIEQ